MPPDNPWDGAPVDLTAWQERPTRSEGPAIEVDGAWIANPLCLTMRGGRDHPDLELDVRHINGRWQPTTVTITSDGYLDPGTLPVMPSMLRWVAGNLDRLIHDGVIRASHRPAWTVSDAGNLASAGPLPRTPDAHLQHHEAHKRRQRRRYLTPDLLAEVAEVYRANPGRPTESVREHFTISKATASRWVRAARADGVLD